MTRAFALALAAAVAIAASASPAGADESWWDPPSHEVYVPKLREPVRSVLGFDFGIGGLVCSGCEPGGGLGVDAHAGALVHERLAVLVDAWSVIYLLPAGEETGTVSSTLATAAAQLWITPVVWVRAGVGGGVFARVSTGPERVFGGPAASLAVGGELRHRPDFGVNLAARIGGALYREEGEGVPVLQFAVMVGYHWL